MSDISAKFIVVLGPNPAWQKTLFFKELITGEVNRAYAMNSFPSGKGINFARASSVWGKNHTLLLQFAGGYTGKLICDGLEAEGIRRSHAALAKAELILHVLDASEPLTPDDERHLAEFAGKKRILIRNKADLPSRLELPAAATPVVNVSCLTGHGLEALKDAIQTLVWSGQSKPGMSEVAINSRHEDALQRAHAATERAIAALSAGAGLELAALELRLAANAVGEVVGKTTTEDLLDAIFSTFCLGK